MKLYQEIKHFFQETPGCSCPEGVFNNIDYQIEDDGISGRKITVGERLLIYIINMDGKSNIQGVIKSALEQGIEERDIRGLNRFKKMATPPCPAPGDVSRGKRIS